jgi:hypothetical protein
VGLVRDVRASRFVGWAIGLASLFSVFFLPFWNLTSVSDTQFDTLYVALRFTVYNLGTILQWNIAQATVLALLTLGASALVALSGVLGTYPRGAGAAGVVGMLGLTAGPFLLFPGNTFSFDSFGIGFWALWVLSIANLFVGIALLGRGGAVSPAPAPVPSEPPTTGAGTVPAPSQ